MKIVTVRDSPANDPQSDVMNPPEPPARKPARKRVRRYFETGPRRIQPLSPAITLLVNEQKISGKTDTRWAEDVFGISPAQWYKLRAGQTSLGPHTLIMAIKRFPHLRDRLISALADAPASPSRRARSQG